MTLCEFLENVAVVSDYAEISNLYVKPNETICFSKEYMNFVWEAGRNNGYNGIVELVEEDDNADDDCRKLVEWLNLRVDCVYIKDAKTLMIDLGE